METLPIQPQIIVRYSEITLKGKNRGQFEKQMARNARRHLREQGPWQVIRQHARLVVTGGEEPATAVDILRGLPGVANVSLARPVARDPEPLAQAACELMARLLENRRQVRGPVSFRVEVDRKDKHYPLKSMELAAVLGTAIQAQFPDLIVNLSQPDLVVMVEVWPDHALLFDEKIPGPGGLPVGSSGKVVCLLSGGIDSPVAAHMLMARGCPVIYLNFHSYPYIGEQSKEKVQDLVRFLARFQPQSRLIIAPFAEIQEAIRDTCPEGMRTILYRRLMNHVANRVARDHGALALATGEAVGQVASQTLENMTAIQDPADYPILQPLIALPKVEIVQRAQRIGTFPISIQPFPDCCTLFQPRRPETRVKLDKVREAEAALPVDDLVNRCLERLEITDYGPEYYPARYEAGTG